MKNLLEHLHEFDREPFHEALKQLIAAREQGICKDRGTVHARLLHELSDITPSAIVLDQDRIVIGQPSDITPDRKSRLHRMLFDLCPWRKGPFNVFGIDIDSEWSSHIKWNRLKDHIAPLNGRRILDIGCSNGYYMFRMVSHGPRMVLGIDPFLTFYHQFQTLNHFMRLQNVFCIPAGLEELPVMHSYFDTVFCMGILYHRRSPMDTLNRIHAHMRPGAELVLETLILSGDSETALCPYPRYAKMRNVFFLPTVRCLAGWLDRCGFENVRCVSTARTTLHEQRKTEWINSESLEDFLSPDTPDITIEGYPAPIRAIVIATAKQGSQPGC